jgi:hypothetical protein
MRKVFKDEKLQTEFDKNGFVVLTIFNQQQLDFLQSLTKEEVQNVNAPNTGTHKHDYKLSFYDSNTDYKNFLFDAITANIFPAFEDVLDNYEPLIINYFNKRQDQGEVPIHQNWTFVDEQNFTSVSVWCPLIPTSRANGTLEVVQGTHKVTGLYRGAKTPFSFDKLREVLKQKYFQPFELQPGQVAILDDSLIHYSSPNKLDVQRKAFQIIAKPKEAQALYFHQDVYQPEGELEVFKVNKNFFLNFNMNERPNGVPSLGKVPFKVHFYNEEEFLDMIARRDEIMASEAFKSLRCIPETA